VVANKHRQALFHFESIRFLQLRADTDEELLTTGELRYIVDAAHIATVDSIRDPLTGAEIAVDQQALDPTLYQLSAAKPWLPRTSVIRFTTADQQLVLRTTNTDTYIEHKTSLPSWMTADLGTQHLELHSHGALVNSIAHVPPPILARARRQHPWIIRNPQAWLDAKLRRPTTSRSRVA
jgi:hypothetical protein